MKKIICLDQPQAHIEDVLNSKVPTLIISEGKVTYSKEFIAKHQKYFLLVDSYSELLTQQSVAQRIAEFKPSYVFASTEKHTPIAVKVAEMLKIQSPCTHKQLEFFYNKIKMRHFLKDDVLVPFEKFTTKTLSEGKYFLKPVNATGSFGASRFQIPQDRYPDVESKFKDVPFTLEKYIEGREYCIDLFLDKKKPYILGISLTEFFENSNIEKSHLAGPILEAEIIEQVLAEIDKICQRLEYSDGALHIEFRVDQNQNFKFIEWHPRPGGGQVPEVNRLSSGNDIVEYYTCFLRDEALPEAKPQLKFAYVEFFMTLAEYLKFDKKKESLHELKLLHKKERPLTRGLDRLGYFMLTANTQEALNEKLTQLKA